MNLAPIPEAFPALQDNPEWDDVCKKCGICRTAKTYRIWGEGNPSAAVVLLGEGPGEEEDLSGRPFVGRAGWILDRALREAGIERSSVFIANSVKCRPINAAGKNRPPSIEELTHCRTWLDEELACLPNKKVIVALGGAALWSLLAPNVPTGGVMENQGRTFWSERYQCTVVATVHPGLILRKPGEAQWLPLDLRKAVEIATTGRPPTLKQPRYQVVRTIADAKEMETDLARALYLVWDWETAPNPLTYGDAVHPTQALGYCVSFCGEDGFAWVAPRYGANLMPLWRPAERDQLDVILRRVFLSPVPKIGHHVAFDYNVTLGTLGVRTANVVGDTMIASHTLYNHLSERAHGLKRMSDVYTEYGRYDDAGDQWLTEHGYTKDGRPNGAFIYKIPNAINWPYNATDSIVPWLIHPILEVKLRAAGLWEAYRERVDFCLHYAELDRRGVPVSRQRLTDLSTDLTAAMTAVREEIGRIVTTWKCDEHGRVFYLKCCDRAKGGAKADGYPGEPLNPNSGPQVADYLYGYQGLPITARTETGLPSTKEEVLLQFVDVEPLVQATIHFRTYSKLKGTYVDGKKGTGGILAGLDPDDYARPSTLLTAVETLRLATRRPFPVHLISRPLPVFNCPKHGRYRLPDRSEAPCCALAEKAVLNIRGMVRPRSDREVLLSGDWEQEEYVLAAIAAKQTDMEEACLDRREDAHAFVMKLMSGHSKTEFQDAEGQWLSTSAEVAYGNMRSDYKSVNFMVLYLGGAPHLARSLKISVEAAAQMIEDYYARLPNIRVWQQGIIKALHETGRVVGLFQTARALPNIYSPWRGDRNEAERAAVNFPFQNGGAHVLMRTVNRFMPRLRKTRLPARLLFTVHDELVCIARRDIAAEVGALLQEEMERPHPELVGGCGIPRGVRASVKYMQEWGGPAIPTSAL